VPQYYSGKSDFSISLRVSSPCKNKNIVVSDGSKIVKKVFLRQLNPAEMIRLALTRKEVENTRGLNVHVQD